MHTRNRHKGHYDFPELIRVCPGLKAFVGINQHGVETIDFSDPEGVKMLNAALLKHFYGVADWDIPASYLCPPVPGRADYIHTMADLLSVSNDGKIPRGPSVRVLDIGIGANCIYPIIGIKGGISDAAGGWGF
jgi:23S rRNA (adenine1618-N6)-methyltransferase